MTFAIQSLLDTDLYKFTMWQALLHSHPGAQAEYRFVCRNTPAFPLAELKEAVEAWLLHAEKSENTREHASRLEKALAQVHKQDTLESGDLGVLTTTDGAVLVTELTQFLPVLEQSGVGAGGDSGPQ